jgi:hypothetical protein
MLDTNIVLFILSNIRFNFLNFPVGFILFDFIQ